MEWIVEEVPMVKINGEVLSTGFMKDRELIRCKDCKHYQPDKYDPGYGDCFGKCDNLVKVDDNWFCPGGEKKDS